MRPRFAAADGSMPALLELRFMAVSILASRGLLPGSWCGESKRSRAAGPDFGQQITSGDLLRKGGLST